ncbi:MAG TPA: type II toxin-antitoxin system RelE/ParE family toxin [Rhizobiaceae bacterium]|nr:type II toxin-antitoxin system RelE/ParE family toxin [Rhizobiaceae bacterium]
MRVVISARVKTFLQAEKSYLSRHSTSAWKMLAVRLRQTRKLLAECPLAGSAKALPMKGLRRIVMGDYVLDYEVRNGEIHILSMRHGRQNDPDLEYEPDFGDETGHASEDVR